MRKVKNIIIALIILYFAYQYFGNSEDYDRKIADSEKIYNKIFSILGESSDSNNNIETENYAETMSAEAMYSDNYADNEYIFPKSDSEYITASDLRAMTSEELRLARNEIYARHGRMFKDKALQNYFDSKSWYTPSVRPEDFNEQWLNEYEKANAKLIKSFE